MDQKFYSNRIVFITENDVKAIEKLYIMNDRTVDASFIQNFTDDPNNILVASYQLIKHESNLISS